MKSITLAALASLLLLGQSQAAAPVFKGAAGLPFGGANPVRLVNSLLEVSATGTPVRTLLDFNSDLNGDIAVLDPVAKTVTLGFGDGLGSYTSPQVLTLDAASTPYDLAVGDVVGSPIPDLVIAAGSELLVYEYASPFGAPAHFAAPAGVTLTKAVVVDWDGDGILDVVAAGTADDGQGGTAVHIAIYLGDGTTLGAATDYPVQAPERSVSALAVADMNGDGINDVIFSDSSNQSFVVLRGDAQHQLQLDPGNNVLSYRTDTDGFAPLALAVGDVGGDGHPDVALYGVNYNSVNGESDGMLQLWRGDGDFFSIFASNHYSLFVVPSPFQNYPPGDVAIGDLDGDGSLDIAVASPQTSQVYVLSGPFNATNNAADAATPATFTVGSAPFTAGNGPSSLGFEDLDNDGSLDLVTANHDSTNQLSILIQGALLPATPDFYNYAASKTKPYEFDATLTSIPGVTPRLHVQYSATPDDAGSWKDLPGGGVMTLSGNHYVLKTTNIPFGTLKFRVVASDPAHAFGDTISNLSDPHTYLSKPDASIGLTVLKPAPNTTGFVGKGVYDNLGKETISKDVDQATTQLFGIRVDNNGDADDTILFTGSGPANGYTVRYFFGPTANGLGTEITNSIVFYGGFACSIPRGKSQFLYLQVRVPATASAGVRQDFVVTATSLKSPGTSDSVSASVKAIAPKDVLFVINNNDSGAGSLRAALGTAQGHKGKTIKFEIPTTSAVTEILVQTPLPGLPPIATKDIMIDGFSQSEFKGGYNGTPQVMIKGATKLAAGLQIATSGCTVRGLGFRNFQDGVLLGIASPGAGKLTTGNVIRGCLFEGNDTGIHLTGGANGNIIGDTETLSLDGASYAASNTFVSLDQGSGNVVGDVGIHIEGQDSDKNLILSNYLGFAPGGAANVSLGFNTAAVEISDGASGNYVGTSTSGAQNIIAGNQGNSSSPDRKGYGVWILGTGTSANFVLNNYFGTTIDGLNANANYGSNIVIEQGASGNRVGGGGTRDANLISGSNASGVLITGVGTDGNVVYGNLIGTNSRGTSALPNIFGGISISDGATDTVVGATKEGFGNTVCGNGVFGIGIFSASGNALYGNFIGEGVNSVSLGNQGYGVVIYGAAVTTPASGNLIGGVKAGEANVIAYNSSSAVYVSGSGIENAIRGNQFVANNGLAIDLAGGTEDGTGQTANDNGDGDAGPNDLQNYPTITSITVSGKKTVIQAHFNTNPAYPKAVSYNFDVYATSPDHVTTWQKAFAEKATLQPSSATSTDGNVTLTINANLSGQLIALTATRNILVGGFWPAAIKDGSTSELSPAVLAPPAQ